MSFEHDEISGFDIDVFDFLEFIILEVFRVCRPIAVVEACSLEGLMHKVRAINSIVSWLESEPILVSFEFLIPSLHGFNTCTACL